MNARKVGGWLVVVLALCGCGEPLAVVPGGRLAGDDVPPPAEWLEVPDTIQVETRPADPYSINIWSIALGPDLYIATGADGTRWSGYLDADAAVRVRVGSSIHALRASVVTEAPERQAVAAAYGEKYGLEPGDNWVTDGLIFRLDRP